MNNTNEMYPIVKRCPSFDENYELQPRTLFPQDTLADVDYNDDGSYTCRHGIEMSRRDSTICDSCFWETQEEEPNNNNPLKRQTTFCTEDGINIIRPYDVARQVSFDLQVSRPYDVESQAYDVESQVSFDLQVSRPYDVESQVSRPYERQVGIGQEQEEGQEGQGTTLTDIIIQQQQQQEQDDLAEERYNFDLYHRDITYRGGANLYYDRESNWHGAIKFETICDRIAKYEWDSVV